MTRLKKNEIWKGIVLMIIGFVCFLIFNFNFNIDRSNIISKIILEAILPVGFIIWGIIYLVIKYLRIRRVELETPLDYTEPVIYELRKFLDKTKETQEKYRTETVQIIADLKTQIDSFSELNINKEQKDKIIEAFKNSITSNLNKEFFSDLNISLTKRLADEKNSRYDSLLKDFEGTKGRLRSETFEIEAKGKINLIIGSTLALIGLAFLYFVIQYGKPMNNENIPLMYYLFISKYSIVILIEILAFFFLRLYKSSLLESKYFQNELTTVELKYGALLTAINFGNENDISNVTFEMSKSERNIILKKGESTTELQKQKIDNSEINSVIRILNSIKEKK